ncbi:UNVERIFIED_ORG: hypothetical protein ABIC43_004906 [Variovorax guangxiensis]
MEKSMWSAFEKVWTVLTQREDKPSQVALAICVITLAVIASCAAAFLYGATARSDGLANRLVGGVVAVLACIGSFSVGGMLGLLFGSPTLGSGQAQSKTEGEGTNSQFGVRPNTSLERVADWLTTMIVGLGLVNLGAIRSEAATMSIWLTQAITGQSSQNGSPGITIALGFGFAGFLLLYLWCMRFLPSELRDSYETLRARAENAEAKARQLLEDFKAKAQFRVQPEMLEQIKSRLILAGVDEAASADVVTRYRLSKKADDEPMENFGPTSDRGYRLEASVKDAGAGKFTVTVTLSVPENSTGRRVFWLLHNSFAPDVLSECPFQPPQGASYTTVVDEAFWIGAIVPLADQGVVRLAFPLGQAPDAPSNFVSDP